MHKKMIVWREAAEAYLNSHSNANIFINVSQAPINWIALLSSVLCWQITYDCLSMNAKG